MNHPEAVKLVDVKAWMVDGPKPGHICIQERSGWKLAACGLWTPNGNVTFDRPKRICQKCRDALPRLRPAPETKNPAAG